MVDYTLLVAMLTLTCIVAVRYLGNRSANTIAATGACGLASGTYTSSANCIASCTAELTGVVENPSDVATEYCGRIGF